MSFVEIRKFILEDLPDYAEIPSVADAIHMAYAKISSAPTDLAGEIAAIQEVAASASVGGARRRKTRRRGGAVTPTKEKAKLVFPYFTNIFILVGVLGGLFTLGKRAFNAYELKERVGAAMTRLYSEINNAARRRLLYIPEEFQNMHFGDLNRVVHFLQRTHETGGTVNIPDGRTLFEICGMYHMTTADFRQLFDLNFMEAFVPGFDRADNLRAIDTAFLEKFKFPRTFITDFYGSAGYRTFDRAYRALTQDQKDEVFMLENNPHMFGLVPPRITSTNVGTHVGERNIPANTDALISLNTVQNGNEMVELMGNPRMIFKKSDIDDWFRSRAAAGRPLTHPIGHQEIKNASQIRRYTARVKRR